MEAKAWQVCSVLAKVKGEREEDLEVVSSFIFSAKMGKNIGCTPVLRKKLITN